MKLKGGYLVVILLLIFVSGCVMMDSTEKYCNCMGLADAREIAVNSECGNRLTETAVCNDVTETWWIDLDIHKDGCRPACVVHTSTKQAEINWRCTGLIT